jgi:alkanesulfonate monooxygenase SsuD/methylene tetrahydromethanopterin reductase-like flavin-dependent oxidoreductase (luciferase family)
MGMEMARDAARQIISFYIGGMGEYYIELLTDFGFGDDCQRIAALYRNRQTRAEAAAAVPDVMLEALAITGDPAECVAELERRRQFGIDLPILNLPTKAPWEVVEAFIRAMAPR